MVQKVLVTEMSKYDKDKVLKKEILNSFPKKIENTLYAHRQKFIGSLPGNRDAFDPSGILGMIEHGDQIIVLDSKKLPSDWHLNVLTDFFPDDHPMKPSANDSPLNFPDTLVIPQDDIPRVLVYTTEVCLSLLAKVRKGNIDGTFDKATKHFTQLFILLVDFKKASTLCAMGWLPDKKVT